MIPDYQTFMLPLLEKIRDSKEYSSEEILEYLAEKFRLTESEKNSRLQTGMPIYKNRIGWAKTYLKKANFLEYSRRGYARITKEGLALLETKPKTIDLNLLKQVPSFQKFQLKSPKASNQDIHIAQTPEEQIESILSGVNATVSSEILAKVKQCPPEFFEHLVLDVLIAMGYGGSFADAVSTTKKSGDEGIDGIIKQDKLGFETIYVQAKRWDKGSVSRPELQKFAGALQGKNAKKGIFITTSTFTKEAEVFAANLSGAKIVLIDGEHLTRLMMEHLVGVTVAETYEIHKMKLDYFEEGN